MKSHYSCQSVPIDLSPGLLAFLIFICLLLMRIQSLHATLKTKPNSRSVNKRKTQSISVRWRSGFDICTNNPLTVTGNSVVSSSLVRSYYLALYIYT